MVKKCTQASECMQLEQIPNIGPATATDLRLLGVHQPQDLIHKDPLQLYQSLCARTGQRHDPCVLDTFMAAVEFMQGGPAKPWWDYTTRRKVTFPEI